MKKLLIILSILSLFSLNGFADETDTTPEGADRCSDEGGKLPSGSSSTEKPASAGAEVKTN